MSEESIGTIVKLLDAQYLEAFLDGDLYLNTPTYFSTMESIDTVRSDEHEGLQSAHQAAELSIRGESGEWIPIEGIINPVTFRTVRSSDFNMLCMYLYVHEHKATFDERNLAFGDSFVWFTNMPEFIRRVRVAAQTQGRGCGYGPVEYVDATTHEGPMGAFRKFSSFSFQQEFRIALKGSGEAPTTLSVGDIRDICLTGKSAELAEIIEKMRPPAQHR